MLHRIWKNSKYFTRFLRVVDACYKQISYSIQINEKKNTQTD